MALCRSKLTLSLSRRYLNLSVNTTKRIAIVGAGPAGFYSAQQILKVEINLNAKTCVILGQGNVAIDVARILSPIDNNIPDVEIDVFEKYPVPFGLVRYGVAPDHPDVKNVTNTFTQIAENNRVHFYGNMIFGKNISLAILKKCYPGIILSYGLPEDKTFNLPGEALNGILPASKIINWYNGKPDYRNVEINLNAKTCVILGQGNVAIDVARILLSPISKLQKTDIADYALEKLSQSKIQTVYLVGRRGPVQASFTAAEFREISKLPNCQLVLKKDDFFHIKDNIASIPKIKKRLTEFQIQKAFEEQSANLDEKHIKTLHVVYKRSPLEFVSDATNPTSIQSILFSINDLQNETDLNSKAVATGKTEYIQTSLVIKCIGYKGQQLDLDVPFDSTKGIVPNKLGRVLEAPGLYCSGWLKTGPVGVLVSTMNNAFETGKCVVEDLKSGVLKWNEDFEKNRNKLIDKFKDYSVTFDEWKILNETEIKRGLEKGKPREKLTDVAEMLRLVNKKHHF